MSALIAILYTILSKIAIRNMQKHPVAVIVNTTSDVRSKRSTIR